MKLKGTKSPSSLFGHPWGTDFVLVAQGSCLSSSHLSCVHSAERRKSRKKRQKALVNSLLRRCPRSCHVTILLGLYGLQLSPCKTQL